MALAARTLALWADAYALGACDSPRRVGERLWRIKSARGEVAVKQFAAAASDAALHEALLLQRLAAPSDARYRVPTLLRTAAGEAMLTGPGGAVLLTRWEAGKFKRYDQCTAADWAALGRALAALHQRLENLALPDLVTLRATLRALDFAAERRTIETDRAHLVRAAGIDRLRLHRYLDERLGLLEQCLHTCLEDFPDDDPQWPIHNDYNQYNYLFAAAAPPLILDWEAAIGAPREFEVVRCLNHLPLERPAMARMFLAGYLRERPLRAARLPWAVDSACLMHALKHWVLQGWLAGRSDSAVALQGAMQIVSMLAAGREQLAEFFMRAVEAGGG